MTMTPIPKAPAAGVATPAASKKVALEFTSIKQLPFWATYRLGIVGANAAGKTRLFGTLSRNWKETEAGDPEPASLDDLIFCETDEGGLNSLREWGVDCPNVLDLGGLVDDDIFRTMPDLPKQLAARAAETKARGVCIDTGSRLVKAVLNVLLKRGLEGSQLYNHLAMEMRKFLFSMRAIHCPIVWNFHIKPPPILEGKDDAGVRIAAGIGSQELEMDIDGRGAKNLVRDACTHIYHLETKELPGGKTTRILTADSRVESKRRMHKYLLAQMPPNLTHFWNELARSVDIPVL